VVLVQEDFLHYLWKFQFFTHKELFTSDHRSIQVFNAGAYNVNSGPDFFNAKVLIGGQLWAGNIEIHVKASDWYVHHHEKDSNYDNVILHVVWENDIEIYHKNNTVIPAIELKPLVSEEVLVRYYNLFSKKSNKINCENQIEKIDKFVLNNWLENLYIERLQQKSEFIVKLLNKSNNDWEKVLFQLLAKNFGLKVNGDSFFNLASSFDFKIIRKEKEKLINLEALFFGQAGFLENDMDDLYFNQLKKEYQYLKLKYNLIPVFNGQFQFFRLRPNNFPTIRIAQLARLYHNQQNLFSKIITTEDLSQIYNLLQVDTSEYWNSHYNFSKLSKKRVKKITRSFVDLVIINTIIPLRFTYSKYIGKPEVEKNIDLARHIKPESNTTIKLFQDLNISVKNAFESQALIQLKTNYCNYNRCLQCSIGNVLLRN
jgi:hypothetical protein